MNLIVTPLSFFPILTSLIMLFLAIHLFEHRRMRGTLDFAYLMLACSIWAFGTGIEMMVPSISEKILFSKISYIGIVAVAPLWFIFCNNFGVNTRKSASFIDFMLWIFPIVSLSLVFTNELHGLVWTGFVPVLGDSGTKLIYQHGIVVYMNAAYSYSLMLLGAVIFVRGVIRNSNLSKKLLALVLFSIALPLISNVIYILFKNYLQGVEITPFSFAITGYILALSIMKYKFLKILPAAKERVYDSIQNGIVVLDTAHTIVDFNASVTRLIGFELTLGRRFDTTLSSEIPNAKIENGAIYVAETKKWIEVAKNILYDDGGHENGQIILMYDVTHEREIQNNLLDSQKFFSSVADFLPDATMVIDKNSKVVVWNKAMEKLTKKPAFELIGKGLEVYGPLFYEEKDLPLANIALQEAILNCKDGIACVASIHSTGNQITKTIRIVDKDGKASYLWGVAQVLYDQEGVPVFAIESIRDVTGNMGHEEELRKKLDEIETLNKLMINREQKMIELKKEMSVLQGMH